MIALGGCRRPLIVFRRCAVRRFRSRITGRSLDNATVQVVPEDFGFNVLREQLVNLGHPVGSFLSDAVRQSDRLSAACPAGISWGIDEILVVLLVCYKSCHWIESESR